MQSMLNEVTRLPGLLHEYDGLVKLCGKAEAATVERLQEQFLGVVDDLENWECSSASRASFALSFSKASASPTDRDLVWFPNMTIASSLTHCWAFKSIAKMHIEELDAILVSTKTLDRQGQQRLLPSLNTNKESVLALAQRICDSMPYFLQPEMKLYGPASTFFTFRTAIQVFQSERYHCEAGLAQCQKMIARMASMGVHVSSL